MIKIQTILFYSLSLIMLSSVAIAKTKYPQMKPGLWETKSKAMGIAIRDCVDQAKIAESEKTADDYVKKNCSNVKDSQSGNVYTTEMTCMIEGKPTIQKTVVTIISANEINSKTSWEFNGKPKVHENHIKRIGDCKAEQSNATEGMTGKDGKFTSYDDMLKDIQANIKKPKK